MQYRYSFIAIAMAESLISRISRVGCVAATHHLPQPILLPLRAASSGRMVRRRDAPYRGGGRGDTLAVMPNYRRCYVPGGMVFFTVVTYRRRPILTLPPARRCLRAALEAVRAHRPFDIPALVLLPDHLHAIGALPRGDDAYSVRWRRIKERFTERYLDGGGPEAPRSGSRRRRGERGVWRRRFWEHSIDDETDLERHVDYIHYNPVKHGLVACPRTGPSRPSTAGCGTATTSPIGAARRMARFPSPISPRLRRNPRRVRRRDAPSPHATRHDGAGTHGASPQRNLQR